MTTTTHLPQSIDSVEFQRMLGAFVRSENGTDDVERAYQNLVQFVNEHVKKQVRVVPAITLNARQLRTAAELANPDGEEDQLQMETVVVLVQRDAFTSRGEDGESIECPAGLYMHYDDMPEEGVTLIPAEAEDRDDALSV